MDCDGRFCGIEQASAPCAVALQIFRDCSRAGPRFTSDMANSPIAFEDERLRLTIPLTDAVAFAMGWSDLDHPEPAEYSRQVIGLRAIDQLQRSEQRRLATML